jgi:hypothetical protein
MDSNFVKPLLLGATSLALILNLGAVNASYVPNARITDAGNGTAATAQNVEADFSAGGGAGDADIFNSADTNWEWVSITTNDEGNTTNGDGTSFDFFTFSVLAGQQFIFDIDSDPSNIDSILRLYDGANSDNTQISFNDDMNLTPTFEATRDSGTSNLLDSLLYYTFASDGFATLRVSDCNFNLSASACDETTILKTAAYDLQISRSLSAVPVPAAVWLFGTALIGFIGMSRRTSVKS